MKIIKLLMNNIFKKKMRLRIILSILLVAAYSTVKAQTPTDTELWTASIFQIKMNKRFQLHLEEQLRFNRNITNLQLGFTEIGLKYILNRYISFKGNYRFIAKPNKDNRNRIALDAYYTWKKCTFPLSVKYRLRFQDTKENTTKHRFTYLRNEFNFQYKINKRVYPYISYEAFYRLNKINQFKNTRVYFGFNWKLNKGIILSTFYCIQHNKNIQYPSQKNIIGIVFLYKI